VFRGGVHVPFTEVFRGGVHIPINICHPNEVNFCIPKVKFQSNSIPFQTPIMPTTLTFISSTLKYNYK
jgi:hypothetical protein